MRLQIASRLAVYALIELAADPDRQMSVAEIGEKYSVSAHHLAKVMHTLGRADMVRSVRGAGGGYKFCGNARRTTLLNVIDLFENISERPDEPGGGERGTDVSNTFNQVLDEVDDIARATLGSITLTTMLKLIDRNRSRQNARLRIDQVEA
jgi:Rrf2 family nitric oxide-sensitive transcriptional repressor